MLRFLQKVQIVELLWLDFFFTAWTKTSAEKVDKKRVIPFLVESIKREMSLVGKTRGPYTDQRCGTRV